MAEDTDRVCAVKWVPFSKGGRSVRWTSTSKEWVTIMRKDNSENFCLTVKDSISSTVGQKLENSLE